MLFDLDGVLIDSEGQYTKFWAWAGEHYHADIDNFAQAIKGTTLGEILLHFAPEHRESIVQGIHDYEQQMDYPLFEGALRFLAALKEAGIPAAIVTSSDDVKMAFLRRQRPEFDEYISAYVTGSQVSHSKPHPEPYIKGAEALGLRPEDCFVFEDSMQGLQSGMASGATVVGLLTSNPREKVEPLCHKVIATIADISVEQMLKIDKKQQ